MKLNLFLIILFAVFVSAGILFVSSNSSQTNTDRMKIAASIYPIADIAKQIGGEQIQVETVIPVGASPHTYDIAASDQEKLVDAGMLFAIGLEFDTQAVEAAKQANSEIKVVDLSESVNLKKFADKHEDEHSDGTDEHLEEVHEGDEEHEGDDSDHASSEGSDDESHSHGEYDPHYWLSIDNGKLIANNIREELSNAYPESREVFENNYSEFINKLEQLEAELITNQAVGNDESVSMSRNIITFHDAFAYLTEEIGVKVVATVEPNPGQQPSVSEIAKLAEKIEEYNVKAIFAEPQLSRDYIDSFVGDYNLSIGELDPLGGVEGRMTYIEVLRFNIININSELS